MTSKEIVVRCLVWYVVALVLAPLPYLVLGMPELISWCMIGLPSLPALIFFVRGGPDPTGIMVIGYLVQFALAAKAISARAPSVRQSSYLIYRCLLVLDVGVAWFGPILALSIIGPGEY